MGREKKGKQIRDEKIGKGRTHDVKRVSRVGAICWYPTEGGSKDVCEERRQEMDLQARLKF